MFDNFLDELYGKLCDMSDEEAYRAYNSYKENPNEPANIYAKHIENECPCDSMTVAQIERHFDKFFREYDGGRVDAVYQDRFDEIQAVWLKDELSRLLPTRQDDKPEFKV